MEPEHLQPAQNTAPVPPVTPTTPPVEERPFVHTYQDDLAQAMDVTEAPVVQAMLADAREREVLAVEEVTERRERKWYGITGILLILVTVAIIGYGAYYYIHLTVPVRPAASVGVFPTTDNIVTGGTSIDKVLANLGTSTPLPTGKPILINLVNDDQTNTLLSNSQFYSFIDATVPEPLQASISVARLGALNTGTAVIPFIIASVSDAIKAQKELTNDELSLVQMFAPALGIDATTAQQAAGQAFQSQYFYNIPVRAVISTTTTAPQTPVFLYGYVGNNVVVITTQPEVLKAVYDAVINQH
ncbi:MAG: hypothetical protein JWM92_294 [Candidatus Nomurabacteria bacterium]|nr:hypothetical protein [Candidatus Nomurabacteria bacterium]